MSVRNSGRRYSRRTALGVLGAGAALALTLPPTRAVQAQSAAARYFIGVYMPHGVARELWLPGPGFDIGYAGCSLAPFDDAEVLGKSYKNKIVSLEGLDLSAGIAGGSTGHDGSRVILTGSAQSGSNASIDQFLALERGLGQSTPLASLVLGVGNGAPELGFCISYAKGGRALPKLISPSDTFAQAFARFLVGDDPAALARAERERALGKSLLDYWSSELTSLAARAPSYEKDKLEQHATALRELEKRVAGQTLACALPNAPDAGAYPRVSAFGGGEPYFDAITDLQIDLLAQAMACDVTRFGTLFLGDLSRTHLDPALPDDVHIDVAHRYSSGGRDGGGDSASWALLARQNRYTSSKLARLLQKLDVAGILEQTVLVAMSDMGNPNKHTSRQVPALLAGGWGGALVGGRHLDFGATGTPNNRLLVAVQQAFGVDSDGFGEATDPAIVTGALELG
jgi:hypothetical protein